MSKDFAAEVVAVRLACSVCGFRAFAPINTSEVLLFSGNELFAVSPQSKELLMKAELPPEEDAAWAGHHLTPRLIVSPDERFCAIVNDYGRYGVVIDLRNRHVTLHLDRGDYYPETTPFPVAFAMHQGKCVLIHGTDWNRVDVSNPVNGRLQTPRVIAPYKDVDNQPEHYLDYFHGRLHVSPESAWILDDGWIWHPVGAPIVWNLTDWLEKNIWEAEDGGSRKELCWRDYHWDVPMTFLDENRVAISGLGEDADKMEDGARVFNVRSEEELNSFAGPSGTFFSDGTNLLSCEVNGLRVWDVNAGISIGKIEGFRPQFQIANTLVQIEDEILSYSVLKS